MIALHTKQIMRKRTVECKHICICLRLPSGAAIIQTQIHEWTVQGVRLLPRNPMLRV